MDYSKLPDEGLINLLSNEEDRLPRAAVDEFLARGGGMVKPLADIVSNDFAWTKDMPEWWEVVHGVFILGVIGTEETVVPLLKSLRFAAASDCDWVTEQLPAIFGKVGIKAIDGLKMIASDWTTNWFARTIAIEALAAITITNPETEKDIFAFIGAIFCNGIEDKDTVSMAGNVLLNFLREEFKDKLIAFGREERRLQEDNFSYCITFDDDYVEQAFNSSKKDIEQYQRDWLSFYDEDEISQRQERWKEEEEEDSDEDYNEDEEYLEDTKPFALDIPKIKIGRNDPCPCGSGKKYKKCCGK